MTPEELRHAGKILLAAANKKQIQYYSNDCCWITCADTNFYFNRWKFRIKPEPRECWVNFYNEDNYSHPSVIVAKAIGYTCGCKPENIAIHMQEVLDE